MNVIKEYRNEQGFVYRIVERQQEYSLEYYGPHKQILCTGSLAVVEQMFAEKTGSVVGFSATLSVTPEIATSVDVYSIDCSHDPCEHPNCDCQPVNAPTDPAPFSE